MKVILIPIVSGFLGTILRGYSRGIEELEIRERAETIQTTTLKKLVSWNTTTTNNNNIDNNSKSNYNNHNT